ncbi:hypothetical protein HS088_TW06G01037 [Tripterygium wilfordii]|uniref:NHL domain-containing protein n=1 Tax=Tripterygium wilfordii TaxID=458696 RepID=A0A7J7DKJ9_TRIWF|nr:uncharacterized protein LOC120000944 [Tripterygium wilfordii]KAF5746861.1 hypothetical protein HS088_TW06G01037 [Tripterygium wilfordii]
MPSQPSEIHSPDADDINEAAFAKRGCCFWIPCFNSNPSPAVGSIWWERIGNAENNPATSNQESWLVRGWNRVREWSELVAGPKWKTFIRRFNKNNRNGNHGFGRQGKFKYDPSSYALNFDEGPGQNAHLDDDIIHRDFSARYAFLGMPSSTKSSMDLGKDAPLFT